MAIPVAAGLKVVLAERLHARDTADAQTAAPGARDPTARPEPAGKAAPTPNADTPDRTR
jgi:hypothetical protein